MELYLIPVNSGEVKEAVIIYRPVLGLAFVGNQRMACLAQSLAEDPSQPVREDIRLFLDKVGFFAPDPPVPPPPEAGPFNPTNVALLMTNECQLRCTYCYAAAGALPRQNLPVEVGFKAIEAVHENLKRLKQTKMLVSLHGGGEPTYLWKNLKAFVAYAKEKTSQTEFSLTSNGIWSEAQTRWIMANITSVGVSMDGSPETQNRQRPLASGKESSRMVMRSLQMMEANHFSFGIRLTAVPPFDRLLDDIRYLCEHTQCRMMQVEAAFNTERGEEGQPTLEEGVQFLETFFAAQRLAESYGRSLRCSGSDPDKITSTACGSPFSSLVVSPAGKIVACFEVLNDAHPLAKIATFGRVTPDGIEVDEEARTRLQRMIAERRASCKDCYCYWTCAGDCLIRGFTGEEGSHLKHGARCELNRLLIREMLLKRIAAGNGVWRRSAGPAVGAAS
jgi:uncharacterized protein